MSSVATAPAGAAPAPSAAEVGTRARRRQVSADLALGVMLAVGLVLLSLVSAGGVALGPNTWTEIAIIVLGAGLAVWALLRGAPGRAWGAATLVLFLAVAGLTFASIAWSVQPANSWVEANRTLSYFVAFVGAMVLARLVPERWPALVGAIGLAATAVSGYALLVKVFPATLDSTDLIGRLSAPFSYWNATGLVAALGLPALLWAGARTERGRALRALTVPAVGILVAVLVLSYSRGALLVAVIGLGCWFALVPLRLRAALILALGAAGGAVIALWALSTRAFTHDLVPLDARTTAGHAFGLLLILVLAVLTVAGFAAAFAADRFVMASGLRRRIGIGLVSLVCLIPIGGLAALATSSRGLTGEVSHVWSALTNPNSGTGDNPGRLVELGNSRPHYWGEGLKVGEHALLKGVGALGYATARTRYVHNAWTVEQAHSYVIETFADFGLIGLGLNLALLVAWALAAGRAVGTPIRFRWRAVSDQASRSASDQPTPEPTGARPEHRAERAGLMTLLVIVLIFGLHSAIDWTWFVPGAAIPALVCAGWLAGRGPLAQPVGRLQRRRTLAAAPGTYAAAIAVVTVAIACAWVVWQPLRSANADAAAITALSNGNTRAALSDARAAVTRDPVAVEPLWYLSAIYSAIGDPRSAHAALAKAVSVQPENPATWEHLGEFNLQRHQPLRALHVLRVALRLDPSSPTTLSAIAQAQRALSARRAR